MNNRLLFKINRRRKEQANVIKTRPIKGDNNMNIRNIMVRKVPIVDLKDIVMLYDEYNQFKSFEFIFTNGVIKSFAISKDFPITAREIVSTLRDLAYQIEDETRYYQFENDDK